MGGKGEYKYLLICNTLPYAWDTGGFARALPHWSVAEYFEKLEQLLGGEFGFNHRGERITFAFTNAVLADKKPVMLENVIEEHSTEVKVEEENCKYFEVVNRVYKDCDNEMWEYYSIKGWHNRVVRYDHMTDLVAQNKWHVTWTGSSQRGSNRDKLLYADDYDAYFIVVPFSRKAVRYDSLSKHIIFEYQCCLQPVNLFGGRIVNDSEDPPHTDIQFILG